MFALGVGGNGDNRQSAIFPPSHPPVRPARPRGDPSRIVEFWVSTGFATDTTFFLEEIGSPVIESKRTRPRYPPRAVALMAGTALLCIAEVTAMAVLWLPLIPLLPMFFAAMVGHGFVLASVVEYTASIARVEPASRPNTTDQPHPPLPEAGPSDTA